MKNQFVKIYLRPIALSVLFSAIGQMIILLLTKIIGLELSKLVKSILLFVITTGAVLLFFPKIFGIPFGKIRMNEWLAKVGFYLPTRFLKHILLGIVLGCISLTGMLLGSFFTGKYVVDLSRITASHLIFSLTPAIWEEILFRGVIMILLIQYSGNLKKAFWWQILIFALCHIKGFELIDLVELFSIALIGYTLTLIAVKSRTLIAGIIYHYLHDAFLYFVQLPDGQYYGFVDNITFYSFLWSSLLINIFIIMLFTVKLKTQGQQSIYNINGTGDVEIFKIAPGQTSGKMGKVERSLFLLYAVATISTLAERLSSVLSPVFLLLSVTVILNILAFVFYRKLGKNMVIIAFIINGICNIVSGYDAFLHGSTRAYIITILTGILYLIIGFFIWTITIRPNTGQKSG